MDGMPRRVDHEERRQHIAAALLRVISRDGLDAVSLRHVATEAGVTAGMVQHYFPSKDAMMQFAMRTASARYEERVQAQLVKLGDEPGPRQVITTLLTALLPEQDVERDDGQVALAFEAYAVTRIDAAQYLEAGNGLLREHLAQLIQDAVGSYQDPIAAATGLLAAAEGLGVHMLSSSLPSRQAHDALDHLIGRVLDAN